MESSEQGVVYRIFTGAHNTSALVCVLLLGRSALRHFGSTPLSVGFSGKPYLRCSTASGSGLVLSYEICMKNSGKHAAKNLQYVRATQTLQVGVDPPVTVDSLPSLRAPTRLVSGAQHCQILTMTNPIENPTQIARIIDRYNSGHVAILLELKVRYYDAFTEKDFFFEERNTVWKDRVDID
jgi:hypothetical protein